MKRLFALFPLQKGTRSEVFSREVKVKKKSISEHRLVDTMSKHGVIVTRDEECYPGESHITVSERWEQGQRIMELTAEELDHGGIPDYETTLKVFDDKGVLIYTLSEYRNGADVGGRYIETIGQRTKKGERQSGHIEWKFNQPYDEAIKSIF